MSRLSLSDAGFNMLCEFEGVKTVPYKDGDKWAAGIGHNSTPLHPVDPSTIYTMEQIMDWFEYDSSAWTAHVNSLLPDNATQNMFDALFSLAYNSGYIIGNLKTMIKSNAFDTDIAIIWKSYKITQKGQVLQALINRRSKEVNLYFSDIPYQSSQGTPVPITENILTSITSGTNPSRNVLSSNSLSISSAQTNNTTPPRIYQEFGPTIILDELSMPMNPVNMQNDTQENQTQTTLS